MDHKNIKLDLSPEEQELFDKIKKQIKEQLNAQQPQGEVKLDDSAISGLYDPNILLDDPIHPRHITTYDREIYVELRMEMSAINEQGQFKEIFQILESFYHIPVPSGADYLPKVSGFIDYFDANLLDCAQKIHKNNGIKEVHI
jgi:hypothetical protein